MAEEFVDDIIAGSTPDVATTTDGDPTKVETPTEETVSTIEQSAPEAEDVPAVAPDKVEVTSPSVEDLAIQLGWNKDYHGPDKVDASTYILRSREIQDSMRDYNKSLKTQVTNLQGSVDALKDHYDRVYKADVSKLQKELNSLKKERRAAIELADVDKVDALDEQIDAINKNLSEPAPSPKPTGNAAYDEWIKDNNWYLTDNEMAAYADTVAAQYAGAPPSRIYALVRNKVAEVFPEKFEAPKQEVKPKEVAPPVVKAKPIGPTSPVEAAKPGGTAPTFTKANLTPDQLGIMRQFVAGGIMTEEQYINDIARMQGE